MEINWKKVEEGNDEEIEKVIKQYIKYAYDLAHRWTRTSDFDYEEAIGVAKEELVVCIKSGKYDPDKGDFIPYLHSCIDNRFRMMLRKKKAQKRGENKDPISLEKEIYDTGGDKAITLKDRIGTNKFNPEKLWLEKEKTREMREIIDFSLDNEIISELEFECYMCWLEGKSQIKIAERLGFSQPHISRLITRAREGLIKGKHQYYNGEGDE